MCTKEQMASAIWCGKLHTARTIDRLASRNPRTKYAPEGIGLGALVVGKARYVRWGAYFDVTEPAQVWSASSEGKGYWWVATGRDFALMHERQMTPVGHAQDAPMFEVAS